MSAERRFGLAALAVLALAFGIRCLGWPDVFPGEGDVVLRIGDGLGQARRAAVTFFAFPRLQVFDPYLNFPDGSVVPNPPLYNLVLATLARALGSTESVFLQVHAWVSPVLGTLAVLPVMAAARGLGGSGLALGAGLLYAVFPVIALSSRLGDADHHATVSLLGSFLLAGGLALLEARGRRLKWLAAGLAAARLALFLTWGGSLAYAATGDGALLAVAAATGRRRVLGALAASNAASALLLLPVVAWLPTPNSGPFSTWTLSFAHPLFAAASAGLALVALGLERRWPGAGWLGRLLRLGAVGVALLAAAALLPGLRRGVADAVAFVGSGSLRSDAAIAELLALLPVPGRVSVADPLRILGGFAWLVPIAPLLPLFASDSQSRPRAFLLAAWCACFGALFVLEYRFGAEFAAPGAVAFALGLREGARRLLPGAPPGLRAGVALALGAGLLLPPVWGSYLPLLRDSLHASREGLGHDDRMLSSPDGTLALFLREVRARTPETAGWLGDGKWPSYGILCRANLGHGVQYLARRASPASGYLHLAGPENLAASDRFFETRSAEEALRIARALHTPYILTLAFPGIRPGSMEERLQRHDGSAAQGLPALEHFRLVTDAPSRGRPLGDALGLPSTPGDVPYKLFEIVQGARLELRGQPGQRVEVELALRSPADRRFQWRSRGRLGPGGRAALVVPYSTEPGPPTRALGPYRVRLGSRQLSVRVAEADVRDGRPVAVGATVRRYPAADAEPR